MSGPENTWPDDLSDVAATDALLDGLAAGRPVPVADLDDGEAATAGLLATWRAELDDRAATVMTTMPVDLPPRPSRWIRAHQRTAAATAVVVAIAASGGVAAAASRPTGPLGGLHKLIWGPPAVHHIDTLAASAAHRLALAAQQINAARRTGSITAADRIRIATQLESVAALLARDSHAPQSLSDRLSRLRTQLFDLPLTAPPAAPTVTDHHGDGTTGSDDNQGGDRHGGRDDSGGDNQGDTNTSGDDNQGPGSQDSGSNDGDSQNGGSDGDQSGSDGGSTSDGGDQSGTDGGSDGGDTQSSDSGSGSGDGDQSGSDGGSSSGGGDSGSD